MKKCRFQQNLMAICNYIYIYIYADLVYNLSCFVRSAYVPLRLGLGCTFMLAYFLKRIRFHTNHMITSQIYCFWLKTVIIFAITFGVTRGAEIALFTFMVTYKVTCSVTSYCSTSRVTLYTSSPTGMMCFCRPNLEKFSILAPPFPSP